MAGMQLLQRTEKRTQRIKKVDEPAKAGHDGISATQGLGTP